MLASDPEVFYGNIGKTVTCLLDDIGEAAIGDGRAGRTLACESHKTLYAQWNTGRICAGLKDDISTSGSVDLINGSLNIAAERNSNIQRFCRGHSQRAYQNNKNHIFHTKIMGFTTKCRSYAVRGPGPPSNNSHPRSCSHWRPCP